MGALDTNLVTLIWLIVGILLIGGEVILPGLVAVFLGVAAVLVAGLRYAGIIEGLTTSLFVWMGLSVGLTASLRRYAKKYLPAETSRGQVNEQVAAVGALVDVLEDVVPNEPTGRIRFQGTTWPAITTGEVIPKGARAQLIVRENLAWIVEPVRELPDGMDDLAENGD